MDEHNTKTTEQLHTEGAQNGDLQSEDAHNTAVSHEVGVYERVAFAATIAASISVLGVGMISIGSLVWSAIDTLGYMLLTAHWILRILIVVGGFIALIAVLDVLIPKRQVTIEHTTHALHVLLIATIASALMVFITFLVITMR